MKIIDLSQPLSNNMTVFPNDPAFYQEEIMNHETDDFSLSLIKTGLHAGTHIDAPYHFHRDGKKVDEIALKELIGPSQIVDINEQEINMEQLSAIKSFGVVLLRTGWDKKWGFPEYFQNNPYLTHEASEFLVEKKIKGLGIDGPSVDMMGKTLVHKKLLSNNIWIVENLANLGKINTTPFEINFIPLSIKAEASPIRAFARL
ncbi:cyclase family protein [Methanobacterium alcaliphilum]|uniref:cyclase family protein n=1 Tax=Methanobacterium alcaliphilum TaxID=392018 RepID=UPI00200B47D7|nr:cyclase family protein [Methanobacterium alcaliphilum]MCK9150854.1 cyclase family protein [Methanobacterium alcaliphilum]